MIVSSLITELQGHFVLWWWVGWDEEVGGRGGESFTDSLPSYTPADPLPYPFPFYPPPQTDADVILHGLTTLKRPVLENAPPSPSLRFHIFLPLLPSSHLSQLIDQWDGARWMVVKV